MRTGCHSEDMFHSEVMFQVFKNMLVDIKTRCQQLNIYSVFVHVLGRYQKSEVGVLT